MSNRIFRAAVGAVATTATLGGLAAAAEAATFRGAVVHHNARAHSFVIAAGSGRLYAVHARRAPRIGARVVVRARRLRNGTYALQHARVMRRGNRHVRVRGVVTWVDRRAGEFTVSAPGVSMLVVRRHTRRAAAADALPTVGSDVVATGTVDDQGDLEDGNVQQVGQSTTMVLEGTVLSVDPTAGTITVSADDEEQSGSGIVVTVPSSLDITQFTPGQEVELQVQPTGTGTATLLGSAEDGNQQAANSQGDSQGDNPGGDAQSQSAQTDDGSGGDAQSGQDGSTQSGPSDSGAGSTSGTTAGGGD